MKEIDGGYKLSELLFGRGDSADEIVNVAAVEFRFWAVVLSFGGNYYKQTNGVAMGTKMGPSYVTISFSDPNWRTESSRTAQ